MKYCGRPRPRKHRICPGRLLLGRVHVSAAVVRVALRLLRERELAGDYAAAFNEFDDETAEFWEGTASDGLNA